MSAPCAEVLVRYARTQRHLEGCPWCGRTIGLFQPSGYQHPHDDLDPDSPIAGWARRCPGSRRRPNQWRPVLVTVWPSGGLL